MATLSNRVGLAGGRQGGVAPAGKNRSPFRCGSHLGVFAKIFAILFRVVTLAHVTLVASAVTAHGPAAVSAALWVASMALAFALWVAL